MLTSPRSSSPSSRRRGTRGPRKNMPLHIIFLKEILLFWQLLLPIYYAAPGSPPSLGLLLGRGMLLLLAFTFLFFYTKIIISIFTLFCFLFLWVVHTFPFSPLYRII